MNEASAVPAGDGPGVIREFIPMEAYEDMQRASRRRVALVMAALWGVPMTLTSLLAADDAVTAVIALVVGVPAALGFGFLWTWTMSIGMRRMVRRIYGGDPRLVPAPPAGEYEYRFPCSYLPSLTMAVGGHLYVGPATWTFVPHIRNLKRHRAPVSIPTTRATQVESVEVQLPVWMKIFTTGPAYRLQVRAASDTAMFLTPDPPVLAPRLREYLQTRSATAD